MQTKILIAGDNLSVTQFPYEELNMETVGYIKTNEELISFADRLRPDIIITPVYLSDGTRTLDYIPQIKEMNTSCRFILYSYNKQFEDLYQAVKNNIEEYLIEPIDNNELYSTLKRILYTIDQDFSNETIRNHKIAIRHLFYSKVIFELNEKHSIDDINETYFTHFDKGYFRVVDIKIRFSSEKTNNEPTLHNLQRNIHELILSEMSVLCHDILFDNRFAGIMILLNYPIKLDSEIKAKLSNLIPLLEASHLTTPHIDITICAGGAHRNLHEIQESRNEALDESWSRLLEGSEKVLFWESQEDWTLQSSLNFNSIRIKVKAACETLNLNEFIDGMEEFFRLPSTILRCKEARMFTREIKDYLFEVNSELISSFADIDTVYTGARKALSMSNSLEEYKETFISQCSWIFNCIHKSTDTRQIKIIRQAELYLKQNYNKDIGASTVADKVNLSPAYFSYLFKKETGENFSVYLLNLRIKMAKDYLKKSDLSIKEISEVTGFTNQRYFSKKFKSILGITPSEYRDFYN